MSRAPSRNGVNVGNMASQFLTTEELEVWTKFMVAILSNSKTYTDLKNDIVSAGKSADLALAEWKARVGNGKDPYR